MNLYATPTDLIARPGAHAAASTALLVDLLEMVSRQIDEFCRRHFYTEQATRFFSIGDSGNVMVDDILTITSLTTDSEADGTFDGETWTEGTDFIAYPLNHYPKTRLDVTGWGDYSFAEKNYYLKLVGTFGYGDGTSDPWEATDITGTVADASTTTLSISSEGTLVVGQTIKVGSEQMYVSAVTSDASNEATVTRGINGTTAAAHSAAVVSVAQYPSSIRRAAMQLAIEAYAESGRDGSLQNERIGDYSYQRWNSSQANMRLLQMVGIYAR